LIGAHIDSFDLGTGALDNGANVSLVIELARQIKNWVLYLNAPFALYSLMVKNKVFTVRGGIRKRT
jgi:Zn-dependent M28 family amino/carboxypeptidase